MNAAPIRLIPPSRILALTALSTLTLWLGQGCASVNQNRLSIGGEPVPAFTRIEAHAPAGGPSLIAGTRDHWEATTIVVPVDGTRHQPTYTRSQPNYQSTPRATGVHPDADSALDLASPGGPQFWEAVAGPFHAASDIVKFIPRAFGAMPWTVTSSPSEPFQRYRAGGAVDAPSLTPEPAPIATRSE